MNTSNPNHPFGRRVLFLVFLCFLVLGCHKQHENVDKKASDPCNCPDRVTPVDSSSVLGCWVLMDSLIYSHVGGFVITPWIPVHGDSVVIRLEADSSFCSDSSFPWSFAHFNRFQAEGNYLYLVPSSYGPTSISLDSGYLILTRNMVDMGVSERYKRL